MERLTSRNKRGYVFLKGEKSNYAGCSFGCPIHEGIKKLESAFEKLAEYEDLEEQGKLLKLPCAVGDTVYRVRCETFVECCSILGFAEGRTVCYMVYIDPDEEDVIEVTDFGKTVFLTREEAEAALKGLLTSKQP